MAEGLPDKTVECLGLDLCDTMSFVALQEKLTAEQPEVAMLINNAGCGYLGNLGEVETSTQTRMIDLNLRALTAVTNIHAGGEPHHQRFLHCLLLPQPPHDGVFLHQGVCVLLHGGPL